MKKIIFILLSITTMLMAQEGKVVDGSNLEVLGEDYSSIPDDELVTLAESGDTLAQYNLGLLVQELELTGNASRLDYIKRDKYYWFELAAAGEHPRSSTIIGKEYLSIFGHYKTQDYTKAVEYFSIGMLEDPEATLLMSILTYFGLGTPKDEKLGAKYLKYVQKTFYRVPSMVYLEKELVQMIRELTAIDNPEALFILGDFYYSGKTESYIKDYKKAYRVFTKSAELGNSSAAYMLGLMLYDGIGILKDLAQSYNWMTISAEAGNLPAVIKAGIMNYFGDGTEVDLTKAFNWFKISAEQNDSLSQYFLGVIYFKGEGVEQDLPLTKFWIKKAFENGSTTAKEFWDKNELWLIP